VLEATPAEICRHGRGKNVAASHNLNKFRLLFNTVADVREVLRETAMLPGPDGTYVTLPVSAPPILGVVHGQIRVVNQPAWMWLLSMLNPLEHGRLRICEKCDRLYVAARRDQLGCSARCGDAIFMRKYRSPNYRKRRHAAQGIAKAKDALERRRLHLALREEDQKPPAVTPVLWKLGT